jgi:hypothetical protein
VATPDGVLLGRCEGEPECCVFSRSVDDLLGNLRGLSPAAEVGEHESAIPSPVLLR